MIGALIVVGAVFVVVWKIKEHEDAKRKEKNKEREERETEWASEREEALKMTSFGDIKAPFATVTRTQPVLEDRYVP